MAFFVVSYDLVKQKDYPELTAAFAELDCVKCLLSQYLVAAACDATTLYDYLLPHIDSDDRLMVIEFFHRPVWNRGIVGTKAWIDAHFP